MNLEALYDLADEVRESYIPTPDEDVPYVGLEHVSQQTLQLLGRGSSLEVESNKYKFKKGDILFGTLRPYFRKIIIAPFDGVCSTEYSVIRPKDSSKANFVFYFLANEKFIEYATTNSVGARPRTKWKLFSDYKIRKTTDQEKTDIGIKLRCLDDLIENNRRRIQLLEESARLLYQEWFVHLRFPGHEQVKIIDGVPEGWDRLSVTECCEKSTYGYTASASQDAIGPKFLRITDIVPSSISWADVPYCEADEATAKKYQLKEGDIVVARTGATVGYAKRMPSLSEPVIYASYLVKFSPNKSVVDDLLLGVFMESEQYKDFVRGNAGGAAQPNANAQILGGAKLLVPSELLQKEFRSNVAPLIEQKFLLEKQNASLAKARDLLLPKLMSGELTV